MADKKINKGISRIDQDAKRTHGWFARVRFQGETLSKFFSDLKHGGRDAAMVAALAWRNEQETGLGKPRTEKTVVTQCRSNTGVIGVSWVETRQMYHVAWVKADGKRGGSTVSVHKYGSKERALRVATKLRTEKEKLRREAVKNSGK